MTVSDGVSPSPKQGRGMDGDGSPTPPPLNVPVRTDGSMDTWEWLVG